MKTSKALIRGAAALVCLLGVLSCEKDFTGRAIRFNARTRQGSSLTRTVYSGEMYTESGRTFERIDWKQGDRIILNMKNDETDLSQEIYEVTGISTSNVYSEGDLEPVNSEDGLVWGEGTHDFWAGYPSSVTVNGYSLSAVIPPFQDNYLSSTVNGLSTYEPDMSTAFMVAGLQTVPTGGISLDFYPAFTTFDITASANTNLTVKSLVLETTTSHIPANVALSGTAVATFNPAAEMSRTFSATGTGQQLTAVFKNASGEESYPSISTTSSLQCRLFALPLEITGVRLIYTLGDNSTRAINLEQGGEWFVFPPCTKVNITGLLVPGADWEITFDSPRQERWVIHPFIEIGVE